MEKILIIEDDADIREGVRILLEGEGYSVSEAENGRKGLELLKEEPDLVILDVMMPGMSGLKTCEEIRKISYVPVLFLTAKSQESDKLIGLMAGGEQRIGADTVINRPADLPHIQRRRNIGQRAAAPGRRASGHDQASLAERTQQRGAARDRPFPADHLHRHIKMKIHLNPLL